MTLMTTLGATQMTIDHLVNEMDDNDLRSVLRAPKGTIKGHARERIPGTRRVVHFGIRPREIRDPTSRNAVGATAFQLACVPPLHNMIGSAARRRPRPDENH